MMNYLLRPLSILVQVPYARHTLADRTKTVANRTFAPLSSLALGEPGWPGADIAAVMMGLGNTCLMLLQYGTRTVLCCWCCTRTRTVRRRARAYRRTVPRAIRLASASSEEEQQSWLAPAQNVTSRR